MGPQPVGHGYKVHPGGIPTPVVMMFQWGHNLSVMDTGYVECECDEDYLFQWGHNLSVMDTSFPC